MNDKCFGGVIFIECLPVERRGDIKRPTGIKIHDGFVLLALFLEEFDAKRKIING